MKNNVMRRMLSVSLAAAMVVSLSACGPKETEQA